MTVKMMTMMITNTCQFQYLNDSNVFVQARLHPLSRQVSSVRDDEMIVFLFISRGQGPH